MAEKSKKDLKLYIATMGHLFPWCDEGSFYPYGTSENDRLKYFATKFNSVTIRSTFFGQPKMEMYTKWLESVKDCDSFRFIIVAPKLLTYSNVAKDVKRIWDFFWEGNAYRGGCRALHQANKLGCILIEFPSTFGFSKKNVNKLLSLNALIPGNVRCAIEFRHWSWWEHQKETEQIFKSFPRWCISTPYLENGLVEFGWAGNLPSTRVRATEETIPVLITSKFIFLNFYGTMGRYLGSYDESSFLERIVSRIGKYQDIETVFCSFNNSESSYCYPLPGMYLGGIPLRPKIKELPSHTQVDLPCSLHDAKRFKKIWDEVEECPYQIDESGYIEMVFVS